LPKAKRRAGRADLNRNRITHSQPAIITTRRPKPERADVPELTPEEHKRRADAAGALFREIVRRAR
jgi:hypothetical protein